MKKVFYLFLLLFSFTVCTVTLVSCTKTETKEDWKEKVVFENTSYDYDGKEHSILATGYPEEATVKYSGNGKVKPGEYRVFAKIAYNSEELSLNATMTINKLKSVIKADSKQTFYAGDLGKRPVYEINNDEQEVKMVVKSGDKVLDGSYLYQPGTYEVELSADKTAYYTACEPVKITVEVKTSRYDVSFADKNEIYDGTEKALTLTGDLPNGYTVEYTDNIGTKVGKYYAIAIIKDANDKVCETHRAILNIDYADDKDFEDYLDAFFVEYLEGDTIAINIFCEDPESFGLAHYPAKWYTYTKSDNYDEDLKETIAYFEELLDQLESYSDSPLSQRQLIAYGQIHSFINGQLKHYEIENSNFMELHYIDQFGGYVADFGTYMTAYTFRTKQDVDDVLDFIKSTKEAFPSYLAYLDDKVAKGYPLSDSTIRKMTKYLDEVLDAHDPNEGKYYYLKDALCDKISAATDLLTVDEIKNYNDAISASLTNDFMVGVKTLRDGLQNYLGKLAPENEGYWTAYGDAGKEMFKLELTNLFGIDDFNFTSYITELSDAMNKYSKLSSDALNTLINKYKIASNSDLTRLLDSCAIYDGTPAEMIVFLKEFAKTIVPTLENEPNITIKEMDEASAKVSNAVAYYMKSAVDSNATEYITLNPVKLGDKNDVLGTMSHEGYPGHLYAYIYSKQLDIHNISKIMTSTAHGEGWATYVELKLYEYAIANAKSAKETEVFQYLYYNQLSGFLLETRIDVGIHYQGWKISDVASFLDKNGYNKNAATDIFNLLIETPASYAAYGYGKLFFYNLHQEAKSILGDCYNEIDFNAMLLSKGWTSLGVLKETYNAYIEDQCFKYGIDLA